MLAAIREGMTFIVRHRALRLAIAAWTGGNIAKTGLIAGIVSDKFDQLAAFLRSPTGQKWTTMLDIMERTQDSTALSTRDQFACGIAWGWRAQNNWRLSLAKFSAVPVPQTGEPTTENRAGASDPGERWAP